MELLKKADRLLLQLKAGRLAIDQAVEQLEAAQKETLCCLSLAQARELRNLGASWETAMRLSLIGRLTGDNNKDHEIYCIVRDTIQ